MPIKNISPKEASALLDQQPGRVYLDVRSIPEFFRGHPRGAVNVPLAHADAASGQMVPNPDFLRVVRANFPPETPLLIGCFSGGRSLKAAEVLDQAGYGDVTNVRCGCGGAHDSIGRVLDPG